MRKALFLFIMLLMSCTLFYHPPRRDEFNLGKQELNRHDSVLIRKDGFYIWDSKIDTIDELNNNKVRIYRIMALLNNNEYMESFEIWAKDKNDAMNLFDNAYFKKKRKRRNCYYGLYNVMDSSLLEIEIVFPDRPIRKNFHSYRILEIHKNSVILISNTYYDEQSRRKIIEESINREYVFSGYNYTPKSIFE